MVAIVAGNSLGLGLSSLATIGSQGVFGSSDAGRNGQKAYLNVVNGNLVLQAQDDRLMRQGLDVSSLRTYNSQGLLNDDNGDNWTSGNYFQRLVISGGSFGAVGTTISRTAQDGSVSVYVNSPSSPSIYSSTDGDGAYDTIVQSGPQLIWKDGATGTTETYQLNSGAYRLSSAADSAGNILYYTYNANGRIASIGGQTGEATHYEYDANSNLTRIYTTVMESGVLTERTSVRYTYDSASRLQTVTVDLSQSDNSVSDGNVYVTTYTYTNSTSRLVASITQTDGTSLAFTYDSSSRVTSIVDGLAHVTTYTYGSGFTEVTDALGAVTRFNYSDGRLASVVEPAINGSSAATSYYWEADGDLASVVDASGRTTTYTYDVSGNLTRIQDGAGITTDRIYNANNHVTMEQSYATAPTTGALRTRYVYDSDGKNLLRFVMSPDGRIVEYQYNAKGERTSIVRYDAQFDVTALGNNEIPTEAAMVTFVSGYLSKASRTDMGYDTRGQLQTVTEWSAVNASGIGLNDGFQSVTQYTYDYRGMLLNTTSSTGGATIYSYDGLNRLLATTNARGEMINTLYDDLHNRTTLTLANGLVTVSTYDAGGNLITAAQTNPAAQGLGETKYFYDAVNNLRMSQDATGVRQWYFYDSNGRKVGHVDANGTLTRFAYNAADQITRTTVYATALNTTTLLTGSAPNLAVSLSNVMPAELAGDQNSWNAYDSSGRLSKTVDARGAVTERFYDAVSRLIMVKHYEATISLPTTDAPAATSIAPTASSALDRVERYVYNNDGLLLATLDAEGYLTVNSYNTLGQVWMVYRYAKPTPAEQRATGTVDQLKPVADPDDAVENFFYDKKGRLIGKIDAERLLTEYVYDLNGNRTQEIRYSVAYQGSITASTTLTAVRPSTGTSWSSAWTYDSLNRVVQESNAEGTLTTFTYDNVGNLVSTVKALGTAGARTLSARYDLQGRLIGELTGEGSAKLIPGLTQNEIDAVWADYGLKHTYDTAGRRTSTTDALGHRTLFFYNVDGFLTYTVSALGEVERRTYTALNQLSTVTKFGNRFSPTVLATLNGGLHNNSTIQADIIGIANASIDATTTYTYTTTNLTSGITDALGYTTTVTYNAFGEEVTRSQAIGDGRTLVESSVRDRRGLVVGSVSDASGLNIITSAVYDAFGRLTRATDARLNTSEYKYDRLGRTVKVTDPSLAFKSTTYDALGRVYTQTDTFGYTTTYSYDKIARTLTVTTAEGVSSTVAYSRHGQAQSVSDGKGQVTAYSYDLDGNLIETAAPLSTEGRAYDRAGRLIQVTDGRGNKVDYEYDAVNRVFRRTVDPLGLSLVTEFGWDAQGRQISVKDPNQIVTLTQYDKKGQLAKTIIDPTGLNLQTIYTWDGRGKNLTITSPAGTVTSYSYDTLGRRTAEATDPNGLNITKTYSYDANGNVSSVKDANGNRTRFAYDNQNRLVYTVDALGNLRSNTYDSEGRITKVTVHASPINLAQPTSLPPVPVPSDIVNRIQANDSDVIEYRVYDKDSRLKATVDGTGAVVVYVYDNAGKIVERVSYAELINIGSWIPGTVPAPVVDSSRDEHIRTVYDSMNRAIYTVDALGNVTSFVYDANGNVVQTRSIATPIPPGTAATYSAVSAAVAAVENNGKDQVLNVVYDAANRATHTLDGTGSVTVRTYDGNGNIVREVSYANSVSTATAVTREALDAAVAAVANSARDTQSRSVFDAANRQTHSIDGVGAVTVQVYDKDGRVVNRTAYASPVATAIAATKVALDAAVAAIADTSRDKRSLAAYDLAGRLVRSADGMGSVTDYSWDKNGNLVSETRYATALAGASLDVVIGQTANDRTTSYVFDKANRRVFTIDALKGVVEQTYDGAGHVKSTIAHVTPLSSVPSLGAANTEDLTRTAVGLPTSTARVTRYGYDAVGRLIFTVDATNGVIETRYDSAGRIVGSIAYAARLSSSISAPSLANVRSLGDSLRDRVEKHAYNAAGRLAYTVGAEGAVVKYLYDGIGRLTDTTAYNLVIATSVAASVNVIGNAVAPDSAKDQTTKYSYDAGGRVVSVTDALNNVEVNTWDALGNKLTFKNKKSYVWTYTYDAAGRMSSETSPQVDLSIAVADGNGNLQESVQLASSIVTLYAYDSLGNLTQRIEAAGRTATGEQRITSYGYDALGRQIRVTYPPVAVYNAQADSLSTNGASGLAGRTETSATALESRTYYDIFGDAVAGKDVGNAISQKAYDKLGRVAYEVDALGYVTRFERNTFGEATVGTRYGAATNLANITLTSASQAVTKTGVEAVVLAPGFSAGNLRTLTSQYDKVGRVTEVKETAAYTYDTHAEVGHQISASASKTTQNVYNAFGQVVQVNELRNLTDGTYTSTFHYFDRLGHETSTVDALGYLTLRHYDALGNLLDSTEYAKALTAGSWSLAGHGVAVDTLNVDRRVDYTWDQLNRKTGETRKAVEYSASSNGASTFGDLSTSYGYDALGNLTRTTDAQGNSTFSYYDALGRVYAIAAPGLNPTTHAQSPVTEFRRDAYGNVVAKIERSTVVEMATEASPGTMPTAAGDRSTVTAFDSFGRAVQVTNAQGYSTYMSWDAKGNLAKTWQAVTNSSGTGTSTMFEVYEYDKLGQLIKSTTPGSNTLLQGGNVTTAGQSSVAAVAVSMQYNAFGELVARGTAGGTLQEYFDYDNAGRLWRTNEGDGVDRIMLYDALGNVTAELRSGGVANLRAMADASMANLSTDTQRVDITYDEMGRVAQRKLAAREDAQGGVTVRQMTVGIDIQEEQLITPGDEGYANLSTGENRVALNWSNLAMLGSGDVKIVLSYKTNSFHYPEHLDENSGITIPATTVGGTARTQTRIYNASDAASGAVFAWTDPAQGMDWWDNGISTITSVQVLKKNVDGEWREVANVVGGSSRNVIDVVAPADLKDSTVSLKIKLASTSVWSESLPLESFGDMLRYDARGLAAGTYDYLYEVTGRDGIKRTAGTGQLNVTAQTLSALPANITTGGLYNMDYLIMWPTPSPSANQVFNYRVAGSGNAWASLPVVMGVQEGMEGTSYVDTSALPTNSYEFELLSWPDGQAIATAHATGVLNYVAATPAQPVAPVGYPRILNFASTYKSYGDPAVNFGTLQWSFSSGYEALTNMATNARIRPVGGSWVNVPISNSSLIYDDYGNYDTGFHQYLLLGTLGMSSGTYEVEVWKDYYGIKSLGTATVTFNVSGSAHNVTVPVWSPILAPRVAYYTPVYEWRSETRYNVSYNWVWNPTIYLGTDESNNPIYGPNPNPSNWNGTYDENGNQVFAPGHLEPVYTPYTHWYQAQIGTAPVYETDENYNVIYDTVGWEWRNTAVPISAGRPDPATGVTTTTPSYTPGYTIPANPGGRTLTFNTPASSPAASIGMTGAGSTTIVGNADRSVRPVITQKTDRWGNVTEITDPRAAYWKTTYTYNANNQLVTETKPAAESQTAAVTTLYYDKLGRQVATRDALDRINGQIYDALGRVIAEVHADDGTISHSYNTFGERMSTVDAMGYTTTFTYNKLGNILTSSQGGGQIARWGYSGGAAYLGTGSVTQTYTYDQLGRRISETDGEGGVTSYGLDLRGNIVSTTRLGVTTKAAYDAQGRKTAEQDANLAVNTWAWTYFGQLDYKSDGLGLHDYTYNLAGALKLLTRNGGNAINYTYDGAGQLTRVVDTSLNQITTYQYDQAGNKVRERTEQNYVTYQDNHLAYDALGRLRDVADGRAHVEFTYDKVGNRTKVHTYVINNEQLEDTTRYFLYNAMNQQIVVDGVDAAGHINNLQGHILTYDKNGNRTSDKTWGNKVTSVSVAPQIIGYNDENSAAIYSNASITFTKAEGFTDTIYRYDALSRLTSVENDGVQVDARVYDNAGRVIRSGPSDSILQGYVAALNDGVPVDQRMGHETVVNRYNGHGQLDLQLTYNLDGSLRQRVNYSGIDAAGNVTQYIVENLEGEQYTNTYNIGLEHHEGWRQKTINATSSKFLAGVTTMSYDARGNLLGVDDGTLNANDRSFVNDVNGQALMVNQNGNVMRQLIVNGEVLGRFGVGVNTVNPRDNRANPNFAPLVDWELGFQSITSSYPNAAPGTYTTRAGDTLRSIALSSYGDSALWYVIAQANGLQGDNDLRAGQAITIPNQVTGARNAAGTYQPYDPSRIEGDKTPNLPTPPVKEGGGCGGVGKLLMVIVAVVATVFTAGLLSGAVGSLSGIMSAGAGVLTTGSAGLAVGSVGASIGLGGTLAISAAVGSIASQLVGVATGVQEEFSWKGVAFAALTAGVTPGLPNAVSIAGSPLGTTVLRTAVGNAVTQGVMVVTGLQDKFSWKGVAASAVSTGIGNGIAGALANSPGFNSTFGSYAGLAAKYAGSVAGTMAANAVGGGKVSLAQVTIDVFGNALGESIAGNMSTPAAQEAALGQTRYVDGDVARSELQFGRGSRNNFASVNALMDSAPSFDDATAFTADRFEGTDVAGPGGSDIIRKAGASKELLSVTKNIYNGLDDLNAALSMGNQDLRGIQELKASGLRTLGEQRDLIRSSPALMQEMLDRGLTFAKDAEQIGMLGALGNSETVHRIAVATLRAGGAGMASAEGITAQLSGLDSFGSSFVNRMPGDMSVDRAAPGLYMNTLMGLRSHVDSTAFYVGSLNDQQFAQLGQYADTVIGAGGMSNYKQNEALAGVWTGLQGSPQGYARVGEGMSIVARGLGNVARGLSEALGGMAMGEGALANTALGNMLFGAARPMYAVPPKAGGGAGSTSVDLSLKYKEGWTAAQRAEADAKVKLLTESPTVVTASDRAGTAAAMNRYRRAEQLSHGVDVDHKIDLQLGGSKAVDNLWKLDSSVNRSLGVQIQQQIKNLPIGTQINKVTIRN